MSEWISTDSYLPNDQEIVLICDAISGFITLGRFEKEENYFGMMYMEEIENDSYPTHWMPLPNPPISKEEIETECQECGHVWMWWPLDQRICMRCRNIKENI
jgi:hypothetical protein